MAVYQTYINAMNDKIRKAINVNNPFVFKHISNLKVRECAQWALTVGEFSFPMTVHALKEQQGGGLGD